MCSKFLNYSAVALTAMYLASAHAQAGAPAASPIYVSVFGGASFMNDIHTDRYGSDHFWRTTPGYLVGAAVGASVTDNLRAELEVSHGSHNFKTSGGSYPGVVKETYLLGNLWFDLKNDSAFTPYVGGGLGYGWANAAVDVAGDHGLGGTVGGLALQVGAGIKYDISSQVALDLGYRYKSLANLTFHDSDGAADFPHVGLNSHNVQVGLTFKF